MALGHECLRFCKHQSSAMTSVHWIKLGKLKPKEGMCIQQWSVLQPGLESSPLSPGPVFCSSSGWDGQCRNGERIEVGGSGEGKQGEGSSPLTCSWKESWASASSWKARMGVVASLSHLTCTSVSSDTYLRRTGQGTSCQSWENSTSPSPFL